MNESKPKLRKFKLIDKEGYFSTHMYNRELFKRHSKDGIYHGRMVGNVLCTNDDNISNTLIMTMEFKFFEEIIDNSIEQWDGANYPPVGTKCEYSAMDSGKWWECIFIGKVDDFIYVEVPHLECVQKFQLNHIHLRQSKPKSWQEVLCDEYDIELDKHNWTFEVSRRFTESEFIRLAKRIIELSNKH